MSKALAVLQELKECASYWSEYDVPIGIHERIDEAIAELLAQPEHIKEREGSGNMISTDDVCNWKFIVEDIKDYDHVYVNGIRYTEFQPKRKPIFNYTVPDYITDEYIEAYDLGFSDAEKAHGIGE